MERDDLSAVMNCQPPALKIHPRMLPLTSSAFNLKEGDILLRDSKKILIHEEMGWLLTVFRHDKIGLLTVRIMLTRGSLRLSASSLVKTREIQVYLLISRNQVLQTMKVAKSLK